MKKGFTLIELIISVALIGVVITVVVFGVMGARSAKHYIHTPSASESTPFMRGDIVYINGLNITGCVVRTYGPYYGDSKWQYDVLVKGDNGAISTAERLDSFLIKGVKPTVQLEK
jgi:prepilin-type N-terminal cleavage/methylation domain-containing protein